MIGVFKGILSASLLNFLKTYYLVYLISSAPIEENQTTLVLDEGAPRQANRPTYYNIIINGDNTSSVDFGTITGTLKGWYFDGSDWQNDVTISTGLSGTVLTFQTGTEYQAFTDDNYIYIQTNDEYLTRIDKTDYSYQALISITTVDINALLSTNDDAPKHDWDLDTTGVIDCDEGLYPVDYTGTTTNATIYTGRKDWPLLPYGEPAVLLDGTNKAVFPQDLSAASISAVYGMKPDGTKLVLADLSIDTSGAVGTHFITNPSGADCHVAKITLDDGTDVEFLPYVNGNGSDIMVDISGNGNHVDLTLIDTNAANVTQNYYSGRALNGFTIQNNGGNDLYVPNATDGSTITLSGYAITETYNKGKSIADVIKLQNPNFRAQEQALTTNFDYSRVEGDIRDRILIELRKEHTDRNFPTFVYKSGSSWDLGTYINDKNIVEVLGSDNVPSDFTIASNTITAAVDVSFAQLVLDNGDRLTYTGNNSFLLQNSSGSNYGILTTSNVIANQGTQNVFNPLVDGNNNIVECNNYRINYYGGNNLIDYSKEWDLNISGLGQSYINGYSFAGPSNNIRIQGNSVFISASADTTNKVVEFTDMLTNTYNGKYVDFQIEFRDLGSNAASLKVTTTINGVTDTQTETQTNLAVNIPFDNYRIPNVIGNDSGYIQYYYTFNFTNVTDTITYNIIENGIRIDTTSQLSEGGTSIQSIKTLPQLPYNGLDVFDNTLTTPRTKAVTRLLKYTDND